jgi:hypothetical protein
LSKSLAELVAEFEANGGRIQKLDAGASSGMRHRDWKHLTRGTTPPVVTDIERPRMPGKLHIRAGVGAVR